MYLRIMWSNHTTLLTRPLYFNHCYTSIHSQTDTFFDGYLGRGYSIFLFFFTLQHQTLISTHHFSPKPIKYFPRNDLYCKIVPKLSFWQLIVVGSFQKWTNSK